MEVQQLTVLDDSILQRLLKWSRPHDTLSLDRCRKLLADDRNLLIAAFQEGAPVGVIVAYILPRLHNNVVFLYEIDVHSHHRKTGIATRMIAFLKAWSWKNGIPEIFVFTNAANTAAMMLYERTGGKRPNPEDVMFSHEIER